MPTRTSVVFGIGGLVLAACGLVLAETFDAPAFAVGGVIAVIAVFIAREAWFYRGASRAWLLQAAVIAAVIALASAVSALSR
jgi:hypothetical protein